MNLIELNCDTGQTIRTIAKPKNPVRELSYLPDGRFLVFHENSSELTLYSAESFEPEWSKTPPTNADFYAIDPNGRWIGFAERQSVRLYPVQPGGTEKDLHFGAVVKVIAFLPNENSMAVRCWITRFVSSTSILATR